jgi:predicted Zn-ribbon and HTH transcriptional regulator
MNKLEMKLKKHNIETKYIFKNRKQSKKSTISENLRKISKILKNSIKSKQSLKKSPAICKNNLAHLQKS